MDFNLNAEVISAIVGFIFAQYLIPITEKIIESIKNNKNYIGKLYKKYYNTIGRYIFLTKKTAPSLINRKYEYKIYIENNEAICYCSEIIELRQNIFNSVNGKIKRSGINENSEAFFNGKINDYYFQWSEKNINEDNKTIIQSLYDLSDNSINIIGSSVEVHNRKIDNPICVLSREPIMYNNLEQLINETKQLPKELDKVRIVSQIIT